MNRQQQLILYFCQMSIVLAMEMVNPFIPSYIQYLGGMSLEKTALWSALIIIAPMIGMIIMAPCWGALADRFGYKSMLIRAALALCLTQFMASWVTSIPQLLLIRFIQGCFAGFIAAMQTYAAASIDWQQRGSVLGRLQSAKALGTAFGGVVGGIVISLMGVLHVFQIASLLCLFPLCLIVFALPNIKVRPRHKPVRAMSKQAYSINIWIIALLIVFSQIAKFIPNATYPFYVTTILGGQAMMTGILYSIPGMAIILFSHHMGRLFDAQRQQSQKVGSPVPVMKYLLSIGSLAVFVSVAQAMTNHLYLIILLRFFWGMVFAAMLPALITLLSDQAQRQGLWIGLANSFAKMGNLLGVAFGGLGASLLPLNQLFLLSAGCYGIMIGVCFWQLKRPQWQGRYEDISLVN